MNPIPGVVEKKVADSLWDVVRKWWNRHRDLEKRIEGLEAQLAEERSGRLAFERKLAEFEGHPADDNDYWKKDVSSLGKVPRCIKRFLKLITPDTHRVHA